MKRILEGRAAWRGLVIFALILPALILLRWCGEARRATDLAVLPEGLAVKRIVRRSERPSFREGCGVVIYEMKASTATTLTTKGVSGFSDEARDWKATPISTEGTETLVKFRSALGCAGATRADRDRLTAAMTTSGSLYAVWDGERQFLLVTPRLRLVAFVFAT